MLVKNVREGAVIAIGDKITVKVQEITGLTTVKLAITAPQSMQIKEKTEPKDKR